jgi:hypothetical protein
MQEVGCVLNRLDVFNSGFSAAYVHQVYTLHWLSASQYGRWALLQPADHGGDAGLTQMILISHSLTCFQHDLVACLQLALVF